jgi:hypothetical protein
MRSDGAEIAIWLLDQAMPSSPSSPGHEGDVCRSQESESQQKVFNLVRNVPETCSVAAAPSWRRHRVDPLVDPVGLLGVALGKRFRHRSIIRLPLRSCVIHTNRPPAMSGVFTRGPESRCRTKNVKSLHRASERDAVE